MKTETVSGEMQSTGANHVYSETDGPTPGRALAIPPTPLEKGANFNRWRLEVTTDSLKEVAVEARTGYRKDWIQVSTGRLALPIVTVFLLSLS